jgi:hypothetical protein
MSFFLRPVERMREPNGIDENDAALRLYGAQQDPTAVAIACAPISAENCD